MEGTIAQILFFAGNFAPKNWAFCSGQILSISTNTALFSLLGTTYGGDGRVTFGLPNFSGRVPVGVGLGPGLAEISIGEMDGNGTVVLTVNQMPTHTHATPVGIAVSGSNADSESPAGNIFATAGSDAFGTTSNASGAGGTFSMTATGQSQPFSTVQPILGINYLICLYGIFPSRN